MGGAEREHTGARVYFHMQTFSRSAKVKVTFAETSIAALTERILEFA